MQSVDERVKKRDNTHTIHTKRRKKEEEEEAVTTATILTQSKPERRLI